jgi:uncharacterized membrane protein YeaQ/YmgE (transglycosylase-associated protein family)
MLPALELSEAAQHWVNAILIWVGFGVLAGLVAKALIPGREPAGTVGTLSIGIVGSVVGPLLLSHFQGAADFNPISPLGFLVAVGGAFLLLIVYRLLAAFASARRQPDDEIE